MDKTTLTIRERLMIGGLGALTPVMANLLVVDLKHVLAEAELYSILGYIIRCSVLFVIGVVVAYLHDDETNKVKMFQFGMGAPAMLLVGLNGSQVADSDTQQKQIAAIVTPHVEEQPVEVVGPPEPKPQRVGRAKPPEPAHVQPSSVPDASVMSPTESFMHGLVLQKQQQIAIQHQ